jgi:phage shock protein A
MTKPQQSRNGENMSDLVAVLVSNIGALHKQAARLSADVGWLHGRIKSVQRVADRLHHKIENTHARIRILRSQDRLRRRKQSGPSRPEAVKSAVESD